MSNNNLQLRLNLIKRVVITYYPYSGSAIRIDLSSDGTLVIDDNGIKKNYEPDKGLVNDVIHLALSDIFFEESLTGNLDSKDIDWIIEFYNRNRLDHIAVGIKETPLVFLRAFIQAVEFIGRRIGADLSVKHLESVLETKEDDYGTPAVVSKEMQSEYLKIMVSLLRRISERLQDKNGNVMISPLSLIAAMAIVMEAASGATRDEVEAFFGYQYSQIERGLISLIEDSNRKASQLKIANAVYIASEYKDYVDDSFLEDVLNNYSADFLSAANGDIAKSVNDWVNKRTAGMIKRLIADNLSLNMIAILNTVSFEASWQKIYMDEDVEIEDFHNDNGTLSRVNMLRSEEKQLIINNKVIGFLKPYLEREYCFAGILPNEGWSVEQVLEEMTPEEWKMLFATPRRAKVDAKMPEYTFEHEENLTSILNKMGVSSIFDQENANLENMVSIEGAYIDKIVQKTFIDVNRKGTRASAATGVLAAAGGSVLERYEVHLDRPFIFAIIHMHSGLPVFIGTVKKL